jgi:hypothetical protein
MSKPIIATIVTQHLKVTGTVWAGYKSEYEYSLTDRSLPRTKAEALKIAGDFESIKTASIVTRHVTTITTSTPLR